MKRFIRNGVILFVMCFAVLVIVHFETTLAQQFITYTGKVVSISGDFLSVQGSKGDVMYFAIGKKTNYVSAHIPAVGEWVRINYYMKGSNNVAHQVEIIPPPPPPPPPAHATTVTTPQEKESKEKKSIFSCTRCSTSRGTGEKK